MREILADLDTLFGADREGVLCQLAETRGSTPQKAGATMLVLSDGTQRGTLGGGCVEAEVKRRALAILHEADAGPRMQQFLLDNDYGWDDGLICGGRMTVLIAPLRGTRDYYSEYRRLVEAGSGCTEVIELATGRRALFGPDRILAAGLGLESVPVTLPPLSERPKPSTVQGFGLLPTLPRITLLIVGGGHVGQAVASLAKGLDFDVWILDDRDRFASLELFPHAQRHLAGPIGSTLNDLIRSGQVTVNVYALIVTRGHSHDEEALEQLAESSAGYVGMIGSKRKIRLIFDDLLARGISAEALAKVRAPLGLSIGSRTVPEIAISILAELIAVRNGAQAL
jgi:xanthine dehydrogenase accessory factor